MGTEFEGENEGEAGEEGEEEGIVGSCSRHVERCGCRR